MVQGFIGPVHILPYANLHETFWLHGVNIVWVEEVRGGVDS